MKRYNLPKPNYKFKMDYTAESRYKCVPEKDWKDFPSKEMFIRKESNRLAKIMYKKKWLLLNNKQKKNVNATAWHLGD